MHPKDKCVGHVSAILSCINGCKDAVPSGHIYAALMVDGVTLDQYQSLIGILKGNHLIHTSGNLVSLTPQGKLLADKVDKAFGWKRAD